MIGVMRSSPPPTRSTLDRTSPLPLWAQLELELRQRLESGEVVDRLPPEHQLAADYAVSRQTVREAIRRLRDAGLLSRERGRGTFVTTDVVQPLGVVYSLFRNVEAQGRTQSSEVLEIDLGRDAEVATHLGVEPSTELVHIKRRRLADGEPLAVDHAWVPSEIARPLLSADLHHTGLYDELWRLCGVRVDGGWERVRPMMPTPAERRLLGVRAGAPALFVERLGRAQGRAVEWRTTLVRGDRYSLLVEWTPTSRYSVDVTGSER
jgi:GntR family transcriptional regulator